MVWLIPGSSRAHPVIHPMTRGPRFVRAQPQPHRISPMRCIFSEVNDRGGVGVRISRQMRHSRAGIPSALSEVAASAALPPPESGRCVFFVARVIATALLALPVFSSLAACGGGAVEAPPTSAPYVDSASADGGELTCDERARSRTMCIGTLTQRCQSQAGDCDAQCVSREGLPGNSRKNPSIRGELEAPHCRDDCRNGMDACLRSLLSGCPRLCE